MSDLISNKWLSEGFDRLVDNEPFLLRGYDLEAFPEERTGDGNWAFLYLGPNPIGVLWTNGENVGIEPVDSVDTDMLTIENLRLRILKDAGSSALESYQSILERYTSSAEESGELSELDKYIAPST